MLNIRDISTDGINLRINLGIIEPTPTPPPSSTLKLALSFEDNFNNDVGNGITFSQTSGMAVTYATGKVGKGMSATTSCVFKSSIDSAFNFNYSGGDVVSFSTWFNTNNNLNTSYTYFFFLASNSGGHVGIDSDNDGRLRILVRNSANSGYNYYETTGGQGQTGWHLLSVSIKKLPDPSKDWILKLWWDTVLKIDITTTLNNYNIFGSNPYLEFGSSQVSALYDQYYFWHGRELTNDDVSNLYFGGNGRNYTWVQENLP